MRKSKALSALLATIALLVGGLPAMLSAAPASAAVQSIPNLPARWLGLSSPGGGVTCATATNGTIWCWGLAEGPRGVAWDSSKGDLVAGSAVGPMQVGTAKNWTRVEVSVGFACAENTLRELWCWGSGQLGQLGNSGFWNSQTPTLVKSFGKKWYDFTVAPTTACAISDSGLWCWGDGLSLPTLQTWSNATIDNTSVVQRGEVTALMTSGKIWVDNTELTPLAGQTWANMQVAVSGDGSTNLRQSSQLCAVSTGGSAKCYQFRFTGFVMDLGGYKDWISISRIGTAPREPICGLRQKSNPIITCFSSYGQETNTLYDNDRECFNGYKYYTNYQFPVDSISWGGACSIISRQHVKFYNSTLPTTSSIDVPLPTTSKVSALIGGWFEGSVPSDKSYFVWGRLFALTVDGQIFAIGDGKLDERQDNVPNWIVTDVFAPSLIQNPAISSTDRSMVPKTGGAIVTLNGSFLVGVTSISVGTQQVSSWTETPDGTSLSFTSPANTLGGSADVTLTTAAGSATLSNALTYGDSPSAPAITGLSPSDGAITVGWSAPIAVGSSSVTSYVVTTTPGGSTCTWTVGPLNCTVSGLTNGTTYRATVRAFSAVGPGLLSANSASFVPYKAPSAPTIVSIAPSDGQITVTWSASKNNGSAISRYDVEAQPGGNSCSTSGTGTSCTISPLTNGTAYSISVYASNDAGAGDVATTDSAVTPRTLAGAPTNVSINPGDKQLSVSWRAPSSNGGSAVTAYTVTAQPGAVTCTAIAPATSCNLLGLSNGSVYSVTVVSTNPAGDSVASATVNGSPVTIPGKPTISAVEPGSNSVLVRWRAPSATGGASVTNYTVVASPGGNSCSTSGAVLFCTITGLDNGTSYAFTVTATNSAGTGSASASYNGVPAASPSAPRNVTVSPTNQGIIATWAAPNYDGGNAIIGYVATVRQTGDTCTTSASTRTCTFGNLVNGSTYIVDVVAQNNAGNSDSASSSNVTPRTTPSKPTQITLTPGASTIRVSWAAPVSDGGSAVTSYVATATPGSGLTCTSTGTYCDFLNLTAGTSYSVTVVAVNTAGTGTASVAVSAMPFDKPGAPNSVAASADDTQINVTWAAPSTNGGSDITGYVATATPGGLTCNAPSTATSCSIRGLTNGTKYSIRVTAINIAGFGPDALVAGSTVPRGVSIAPTNISVDPQNQSLAVKWRAVTSLADTNGAAITRYVAKAMPSGLTCQVDGSTSGVSNTTCTITGLTNGISQSVTVFAVNDAGTSNASVAVARTPRSAPSIPVGVIVNPLNGALAISWNPPIDNGGVPITSYTVTATAAGVTGSVVSCTSQSGDSRNCVISNLSNGTPYTVSVVAGNDVGYSQSSVALQATPAAVPTSPVNPRPTVGNAQISMRWDAAQDNGSPIVSYHVDLEPGGYGCDVTDLSFLGCTITQLDNGISYSISVTATNAIGDSAPAQVVGTATPRAIASPVQAVYVSAANNQATVSWLPGFNGGSPIQSYQVTATPGGALCQAAGNAAQCVIGNLVNGTQYTFIVVAVNAAGSSQPTLSQKTLIAGTPNVPVAMKVKPGDGMITVTFAPPALNGGTPITNYSVFVNDEVACTVAPAKILSCVVNGLENGSPQIVRVTANNLIGPSVSTAEVVATPGRVSSAVSGVTATAGVGVLTVSWTEPDDDGGSPITGYAVTLTPGGKTCKVDQNTTTCDISGLTVGTAYVAKVVAINGVGTSVSATSNSVKIVGLPTAVRNVSASALAKGAKVYFAAPANTGGSPIRNYYFSVSGPAGFTFDSGPVDATTLKGSYTITGLTKGASYTISVSADNDSGMSPAVTTTVKSK